MGSQRHDRLTSTKLGSPLFLGGLRGARISLRRGLSAARRFADGDPPGCDNAALLALNDSLSIHPERGPLSPWPAFQRLWESSRCRSDAAGIEQALAQALKIRLGIRPEEATRRDLYTSLAYVVRDLTVDRIHESEMRFGTSGRKRVAYLSMEFLVGRLLMANLINLDLAGVVEDALRPLDTSLLELAEFEPDAGLGNGGLGRLAACFLESLATHGYPATGYGICYSHGMFRQEIVEGRQVERLDNWLRSPSPWMIARAERTVPVHFFGRVENGHGNGSGFSPRWIETDVVLGIPRDIPVVGFGGGFVNVLRLWSATSTAELDLELFNHGDYVGAAKKKVQSESISKILYPNDHVEKGRELRLMQEYFFVACSVADVLRDLRAKGARPPQASGLRRVPAQRHAPGPHRRRAHATAGRRRAARLGRRLGPRRPLRRLHEPHAAPGGAREMAGDDARQHPPPPPPDHP